MNFSPDYLKIGDSVGIVAPARSIAPDKIELTEKIIQSWGLKLIKGKNLSGKYFQFSGTYEERLSDLQMMIDNPEIKAIICAGGGYGTIQLIENLNFEKLREYPKWFTGFSDITVLHSAVDVKTSLQTIHSTMPVKFENAGEALISIDTLKKALFGELKEYIFKTDSNSKNGKSEGILTGGNLSILHSLLGTPYELNYHEKILFIEEVDEYLYHIDRMIHSLKLAGKLESLKGLIVGSFNDIHDNENPFGKNVKEIILDVIRNYNYPVVFDFPAGHKDINQALYFGRKINLDVTENNTNITFIEN